MTCRKRRTVEIFFERYADYTGLEFYYRLNNECGSLSGPRKVVLVKKEFELSGKSLYIIAREVNLIGYYLPEIKAIGTHILLRTFQEMKLHRS